MRQYNIVAGILFILPIIDFAVAAPVSVVRGKPQAGVEAVHTSILEHAITSSGKRGNEWEELAEMYARVGVRPKYRPKGGWTKVNKPLTPIPEVPEAEESASSPESSPGRAPPSLPKGDSLQNLWPEHFGHPESDFPAKPESSSQLLGPAGGPTDVGKPPPPIDEEPSQVTSHEHAPPSLLEGSSAAHSSSSAQSLGPAGGPTDVKDPLSSNDEESPPIRTSNPAK